MGRYNLAGGAGTYAYPQNPKLKAVSQTLPGLDGPLRLSKLTATGTLEANPQDVRNSGYYNGWIAAGLVDPNPTPIYNPNNLKLEEATVQMGVGWSEVLSQRYFIPSEEDCWSVLPGPTGSNHMPPWLYFVYNPPSKTNANYQLEKFRLGGPDYPLRLASSCSYSEAVTESGNKVVYGIRFLKPATPFTFTEGTYVGTVGGMPQWRHDWPCYPSVADDRLATAFKYTLVGDHSVHSATNHLLVEIVHIGEAVRTVLGANPTGDDVRANWSALNASGSGHYQTSRIFPSAGSYTPASWADPYTQPGEIFEYKYGYYSSSTQINTSRVAASRWSEEQVQVRANLGEGESGRTVRPFYRIPMINE